jgi:hypothetical protein
MQKTVTKERVGVRFNITGIDAISSFSGRGRGNCDIFSSRTVGLQVEK